MFEQGKRLRVRDYPSTTAPVDSVCITRYLDTDAGTVPGDLCIDVRGSASTLGEALVAFANAALFVLPILSLSANAAVAEAEIELGYDNTPGVTERDYFQSYTPAERGVLRPGRRVDVPATLKLLEALDKYPDSERMLRAANQYRMALGSWRLGRETLSLAHLWMAVEALTKVKLRSELATRGLTEPASLAAQMGVAIAQLDGAVRKDMLFQGDEEAYKKAKKASDGFEHGFLGYDKVRELSANVRRRVARYVREAIFELCGLDGAAYATLTSDPFDKPLADWPIVKYARGKLVGAGNELAAPGNAYPYLRWSHTTKPSGKDSEMAYEISENITPELAEGIHFEMHSFEVWQAD